MTEYRKSNNFIIEMSDNFMKNNNELFRFRATGSLEKNYENYLQTDANGTNYDCTIYHDYPFGGGIETRCSFNRKATSEKHILRTARKDAIQDGDIITLPNKTLLVEDTIIQVDCYAAIPRVCNAKLNILRDIPEETDDDGYFVDDGSNRDEDDSNRVIVAQQPCVMMDNIGNLAAYGVGTWAAENPVLLFQLNSETAMLQADDYFVHGGNRYRVIALGWEKTAPDRTAGILTVTARKEAGSAY